MDRESSVGDIPINLLNLPNSLTLLRILLVPVFVGLLLYGHYDAALITLLIAALTDILDGMVARITDQRTRLGEYLDPLADKASVDVGHYYALRSEFYSRLGGDCGGEP